MNTASSIPACDLLDNEFEVTVFERTGFIVIEDDGMSRLLGPAAATQLCWELIEVLFKQRRRGEAGPFSRELLTDRSI